MTRLRPVDPRLLRAAPALRTHLLLLAPVLALRAALTVTGAVLLARAVVDVWRGAAAGGLLLLAAVVVVRAALDALVDRLGTGARDRTRQQLRSACLDAVSAAGPGWLGQQDRQRLAHTVGPGLDTLDGYVLRVLPALVSAVVVPPLVLVAMARTDLLSTVLLGATLPLVPLFLALVGLATRDRTARSYATLAALSAKVVDLLEGLPGLKVLGRAQGQLTAVARVTERYRSQALAALRWAFVSGLVLDLLATLSVALVAVSAGLRLQAGHLGLTAALTVLLLAPEVYLPLRAVGTQYHAGADALEAAAAALDVLDAPPAPAPQADPGTAVVDLREVTVTHPGRTAPALRGLTLSLRPGEVVALEGPSGGGKSTLLGLLLGVLVPTSGTVTRHDGDRSRLAWCPQRPRSSSRTVAEELRLGDPQATDAEVLSALARCEAPGPQVLLGEDGSSVSAGQRRRVALARALLRARAVAARGEPALVLLDEPSEDLDAHGEAVVAGVVADLRALGTVVLVTHSPSLAAVADRRLRLEDGVLVADARPLPTSGAAVSEDWSPEVAVAARPPHVAPSGAREVLRLLRSDAAGLGRRTAAALLLGVAGTLSGLALTALSGWLLLRAAQHPELQVLSLAVVGVRFTALSKALLRYGERLAAHDVALRLLARTRVRVVAALVPLAPEGLGLWRRGDLLRRFSADVDAVQDTVVRGLLPLAGAAVAGLAAVAATALLAPAAAPALALLLALTALVAPVAARAGRRAAGRGAALAGRRDEAVVGWLDGLPELWVLDQHRQRAGQVTELEEAAAAATRPVRRCGAAAAGATSALAGLAPVVVLAAAGGRGSGLLAGVAALLAVAAVEPVAAIGPVWAALAGAVGRAGRVTALLHAPAPVPEPLLPAVPPGSPVGVGLRAADLAHPGCPPALHDVELDLRPGQRVALVGRSGSGKSTVVAAVLRLLDPVSGVAGVTADERLTPLRDLRAQDVPPLVAGCLQDDHLFATTLRENLRVGRPSATDADLDDVADRLGLLDWVRGLPQGWSTHAGTDGARLSGGQRQRLLVARALLADPDVLVLDEPTAHLDPATEQRVMADVLRATAGRTLLLSTHRSSGLEELDGVLAVGQGTVRARVLAR